MEHLKTDEIVLKQTLNAQFGAQGEKPVFGDRLETGCTGNVPPHCDGFSYLYPMMSYARQWGIKEFPETRSPLVLGTPLHPPDVPVSTEAYKITLCLTSYNIRLVNSEIMTVAHVRGDAEGRCILSWLCTCEFRI
jgi:hypothetical protein